MDTRQLANPEFFFIEAFNFEKLNQLKLGIKVIFEIMRRPNIDTENILATDIR